MVLCKDNNPETNEVDSGVEYDFQFYQIIYFKSGLKIQAKMPKSLID